MFVSTLFLLGGAQAAEVEPKNEIEVPVADNFEAHRGRGPHRHPRGKPKPRPRTRRHAVPGPELGPWRHTAMVNASVLYGDENNGKATPWASLSYHSEVADPNRMSVVALIGVTAVGNYTELLDLGVQGRYYVAGRFAQGLFVGPTVTGSIGLDEDSGWAVLRPGAAVGAKQILPGGLSIEMRFIGEFVPLDTGPLATYGISFGVGASTR